MGNVRLVAVRVVATLVVAFGLIYIAWRWTDSVPWSVWWIAVPLVIAETYSLGESVLYALTMWNAKRRAPAPPAPRGRTVDVFVTTYNEPLELVLKTAVAARDITYPHRTWILDDGKRPEFEEAARLAGIGYLTRGPEWDGRLRFAKAGNINNALFQTSGEFILILDADQVPAPRILDRVLGYFDDESVAFVQTPQEFWNVGKRDPLGSRADLFYGPIQQGKDGWGAAFFCGSNAVLRREALMALGLTRFSQAAMGRTRKALRAGRSRVDELLGSLAVREPTAMPVAEAVLGGLIRSESQFRRGALLSEITFQLQHTFERAVQVGPAISPETFAELAGIIELVEVARTDQALAIHPVDTSSITEDMATAMHLHGMGWTSVYHHEVLVYGLAPEDVGTMLSQRKRWASGSMQVFFADNPLFVRGLSLPQRLMYFATMTSYLNGFAAIAYIAAPLVFLVFGIFPLTADAIVFFAHFLPFFITCQLLFHLAGKGSRGLWRGQQMSFALFPTWIAATLSGAAAALLGRHLTFSVTSKTRQAEGARYRHVLPQLIAMALLAVGAGIGIVRYALGDADLFPTAVTVGWVIVDLALLGVVIGAARYAGPGNTVTDPLPAGPEVDAIQTLATFDLAAEDDSAERASA